MNKSEVKEYWEDRAKKSENNPNATTDDFYLRKLEIKTLKRYIMKYLDKSKDTFKILDLGCGDGFTTINLLKELPKNASIVGCDYSQNMINIADYNKNNLSEEFQKRIEFSVGDATNIDIDFDHNQFDFVITDRCLINLTNEKDQFRAIEGLHKLLIPGGFYLGIENFMDGQYNLNNIRKELALPEIPVRWHNLFFELDQYVNFVSSLFTFHQIVNFSSSYYYATRVIYSKYASLTDQTLDYHHEIHQLAIDLPEMGNFSPIKLTINRK